MPWFSRVQRRCAGYEEEHADGARVRTQQIVHAMYQDVLWLQRALHSINPVQYTLCRHLLRPITRLLLPCAPLRTTARSSSLPLLLQPPILPPRLLPLARLLPRRLCRLERRPRPLAQRELLDALAQQPARRLAILDARPRRLALHHEARWTVEELDGGGCFVLWG